MNCTFHFSCALNSFLSEFILVSSVMLFNSAAQIDVLPSSLISFKIKDQNASSMCVKNKFTIFV